MLPVRSGSGVPTWSAAVAVALLAAASGAGVGCRRPGASPSAAARDGAAPASASAGPLAAPSGSGAGDAGAAPPFVWSATSKILFSKSGRWAAFAGRSRFALVDLETRRTRTFDGAPPEHHELAFDNRCDVSLRGYEGNYTQPFLALDASERRLLRGPPEGSGEASPDVLEDLPSGRSVEVGRAAEVHATLTAARDALVLHADLARRPRAPGGPSMVVDTIDDVPRTLLWDLDDEGLIVEDPAAGITHRVPLRERRAEPGAKPVVRVTDGLFAVVVSATDDGPRRQEMVVVDLAGKSVRARAPYHESTGPFSHVFLSPDGDHLVWSERIAPPPRTPDEDVRESPSRHTCFLAVLGLGSGGRHDRFRTPSCPLLAERPVRIEGRTLVTDATSIPRCTAPVTRRYEIGTGALRGEKRGPAVPEDVDAALLARIERDRRASPAGTARLEKERAFAALHGVEVKLWTEGSRVVATRGSSPDALLLCDKRGGACTALPPLLSGAPVAMGASLDGARLGIATAEGAWIVDVATGATLVTLP